MFAGLDKIARHRPHVPWIAHPDPWS